VVEVVTGGGKTVFAFLCMADLREMDPDVRFLILVPSLALLDQWVVALREELQIPSAQIGIMGGGEKPSPTAKVVVAVINSGRTFSKAFSQKHRTALIVDECHRAGSEKNSEALEGSYVATLGLSATPDREYDDGFERYIIPALGKVIYRYSYVDAARDGVITKFGLVNIKIPMLPDEEAAYNEISAKIARLRFLVHNDPDAEFTLKRLLQRRSANVSKIAWRVPASVKLIDQNRHQRAIVFHERVAEAEKIVRLLSDRGHNAVIYHSGIGAPVRRENLRLFRTGVHDVLVCCRALDEGMNVPETTVAVVASATASLRQRIQRLGRILRPARGKEQAMVYTLYGTLDEENRLRAEANRLGDVSQIKWQRLKVRENGTPTLSK
jgi:superfamily II DNA or RNA helicase